MPLPPLPTAQPAMRMNPAEKMQVARRAVARKLSKLVKHFNNAMVCALTMDAGEVGCGDYNEVITLYKKEIHAYARCLKTVSFVCLRACVRACVRACLHASLSACLPVCLRARLRACLHAM
jgi:hypothetical protein